MNPVILHVVRPYDTVEEYLSAEAWTIEPRAISLLGTRELPPDTLVVFDLGISVGDKLMRAEGKVAAFIPATDEHPSLLRVRYRRYGSQTKAFIERAVTIREEQLAREAASQSSAPPAPAEVAPPAEAPPSPPQEPVPAEAPPRRSLASVRAPAGAALANVDSAPRVQEPSGIHRRAVVRVTAPENRDELLDRLRARMRTRPKPGASRAKTSHE